MVSLKDPFSELRSSAAAARDASNTAAADTLLRRLSVVG
jgi:hypothetical protein